MITPAELSKKELREHHIALWSWLAETGGEFKNPWPGWAKFYVTPTNYCFACVAANELCPNCPCVFVEGIVGHCITNRNSLYRCWSEALTAPTRKKYAKLIAKCWPEENV